MRMIAAALLLTLVTAAPAAAQATTRRDTTAAKTATPPKVIVGVSPFGFDAKSTSFGLSARAGDPLANAFFPPELVLQHQQQIGLSAEQRAAIIRAIQEAQPIFIEAQWQLEPETRALAELVSASRVDEARLQQQIDRVLDVERRIKQSQVALLAAIKNQLTPEQQAQLARLAGRR